MSQRTVLQDQLSRAIEQVESHKAVDSHLVELLKHVERRLHLLEMGLLSADSAFKTNPLTGDRTVQAIVKSLLQSRNDLSSYVPPLRGPDSEPKCTDVKLRIQVQVQLPIEYTITTSKE